MISRPKESLVPLMLLAVTLASRWPLRATWWCLDDWGQLARAAGLVHRDPGLHARWLSQDLWWTLVWPVFGLNPLSHLLCRLILHGMSAVFVARLARRAGSNGPTALLAGTFFAVTPVAFTVLFWASGIQELLAGVFALAAAERWWCGGRRGPVWAVVLGAASMLAKESGLGLPLLFGLHLWWQNRTTTVGIQRDRWLAVVLLLIVATAESLIVINSFATGPTDPYRLGGLKVILGNIGTFGWWLASPGPVFTAQLTWTIAAVGGLAVSGWGGWGAWRWRQGRHLALTAWVAALLSLGPSLVLIQQAHPYLAYVAAAALSLTLAEALPADLWRRKWLLGLTILALTAAGTWQSNHRLHVVRSDGQPADPVVRSARLARDAARSIRAQIPPRNAKGQVEIILLQPPLRPDEVLNAKVKGDRYVVASPRHFALGGDLGPRLIAGPAAQILWANSLLNAPPGACVLCETGRGFEAWGHTWNALLYAALSDLILGHFNLVQAELGRAMALDSQLEMFVYDPGILGAPEAVLRRRFTAFEAWLQAQGASGALTPNEVGRLVQGARRLSALTVP